MSETQITKRAYYVVFVALMLLLVLTVVVADLTTGAFATTMAFLIATAKAVLIILVFMHVKEGGGLIHVFVGAGFLWFTIMIGFVLQDYLSRGLTPH